MKFSAYFGALALLGACAQASYMQVMSDSFSSEEGSLHSGGEVLAKRPGYFARASSAEYDENASRLLLKGDVFINSADQNTICEEAELLLDKKQATFRNFFISNSFLELWLKAKTSHYADDKFFVKGSVVSSCAAQNPEWQIDFSSGTFDQKTKDLTIKNMVFRYHGVPLFWMPYFRINTDERRKSGLLAPKFAIKSKEGFYYEQPYFYAINHASDVELRAQLRSQRGAGIYARYRLADSPYSKLMLDLGYFKEFANYAAKEQLKYDEHYGLRALYERSQIFKQNPNHQEGLYVDYLRINDIDFLNLSSFLSKDDDYLITSKLNYFYTDNQDYAGLYARLYQDTTKASQSDTIQQLPSLHYHRFYDRFGAVSYRFDAMYTNYYSRSNKRLSVLQLNAPLSVRKAFFNDYLNLEFKEQAQVFLLSKALQDDKQFHYRLVSSLGAFSTLYKRYSTFAHSIDMGIYLVHKSAKDLPANEFLSPSQQQEGYFTRWNLETSLIFDDNSSYKHSLHIDTKSLRPSVFESDLEYKNAQFNIWNNLKMDLKTSSLERFFLKANYKAKSYELGGGYFYNKRYDDVFSAQPIYERYLNASFKFALNPFYELFASSYYNIHTHRLENYSIGILHKRRCINYTLEFRQKSSSKLTQSGVKSSKDRGVYLRFNLYPIGGVRYNFALGENDDI